MFEPIKCFIKRGEGSVRIRPADLLT